MNFTLQFQPVDQSVEILLILRIRSVPAARVYKYKESRTRNNSSCRVRNSHPLWSEVQKKKENIIIILPQRKRKNVLCSKKNSVWNLIATEIHINNPQKNIHIKIYFAKANGAKEIQQGSNNNSEKRALYTRLVLGKYSTCSTFKTGTRLRPASAKGRSNSEKMIYIDDSEPEGGKFNAQSECSTYTW